MKPQDLRRKIEELEAKISQATVGIIKERQQYPETASYPNSDEDTFIQDDTTHTIQNDAACDNINAVLDAVLYPQSEQTTYDITILVRPLRSLKHIKFLLPASFYPSFSARYGFTHWAVELNKHIFEVRAENSLGKGGKMKIRVQDNNCQDYSGPSVERYPIGKGTTSINKLHEMKTKLENSGTRKYHFYKNNCQLIAAAMAIVSCRKPSAGWKNLILQRDVLRFINPRNPGDILRLLDKVIPDEEYYKFLKEIADDYTATAKRRKWRPSISLQSQMVISRRIIVDTGQYTLFVLVFPAVITILAVHITAVQIADIRRGVKESSEKAAKYEYDRLRWMEAARTSRRRSLRYSNPDYSVPPYSIVDWRSGSYDYGQNDNERWICAMYGYS